jgi:hypothetical protein
MMSLKAQYKGIHIVEELVDTCVQVMGLKQKHDYIDERFLKFSSTSGPKANWHFNRRYGKEIRHIINQVK